MQSNACGVEGKSRDAAGQWKEAAGRPVALWTEPERGFCRGQAAQQSRNRTKGLYGQSWRWKKRHPKKRAIDSRNSGMGLWHCARAGQTEMPTLRSQGESK